MIVNIVDERLVSYAEEHSSEVSDYLNSLFRTTNLLVPNGRMICDPLQGRFLSAISKMIKPHLILELGTFTGYSALCLSEGLDENGRLITIERNEELKTIQEQFIQRSPYSEVIELVQADALAYLRSYSDKPDLIYLDADKKEYPEFWELIKDIMTPGSWLLVDNVLWHGKVLKTKDDADPNTERIQLFNKMIAEDDDVEKVMLPYRDGLSLIRMK